MISHNKHIYYLFLSNNQKELQVTHFSQMLTPHQNLIFLLKKKNQTVGTFSGVIDTLFKDETRVQSTFQSDLLIPSK
jgi:hypothetical protein